MFQERKFLQFTPHCIVNIPRRIRPLRDIEQTYREPRGNEIIPPSNPSHDNDPLKYDHPDCTLPKHGDDIPHSYEIRPTRDLGPKPPRCPNRPSPNYVELAMYLDDVVNDLLTLRHDDALSDIDSLDL